MGDKVGLAVGLAVGATVAGGPSGTPPPHTQHAMFAVMPLFA